MDSPALTPDASSCNCTPCDRTTTDTPDTLRNVLILNVPKARRDHTTVPVEVRLLGPFEEFLVHWDGSKRKTRPCWNHTDCPHCKLDGYDVRRVAYASAEVYEYDSNGRRSAKLVCLSVPEKQIALAKALPVGTVLKLIRSGSGMGEKLRFELANKKPDPGAVNPAFCARTYMIRFWFRGQVPPDFRVTPPDQLTAPLPNVPLTPPLPFVESEESAERFLFEKYRTNTLAGVVAAMREQEKTPPAPEAAPAVTKTPDAERAEYIANEVKWHDGPASAARNRIEIEAACKRVSNGSFGSFASTYAAELNRTQSDYMTFARVLEEMGEAKAGLLLREIASRRFDAPSCTGQPAPIQTRTSDPVPQADPRPAEPAAPSPAGTNSVTTAPASGPKVGTGSGLGKQILTDLNAQFTFDSEKL